MTATNPNRRIFVRIPPAEHRRVKREAKREAISMPVRPPTYNHPHPNWR